MMLPPRPPDDPRNTTPILRRELIAGGYDDAAIARLVRDEILTRIRRGAYVKTAVWEVLDEVGRYGLVTRAVLKQAKTDVALSHTSAVPEYGGSMWGFDLTTTHLTRLDGRAGRHEAGVQQHGGTVVDGDVVTRNGISVMSATRTALEVTLLADVEASLCFVNHVLHHRLTTLEELRARYAGMVFWPHSLTTEVVLRLADPRMESLAETRCSVLFREQHLPTPVPQHEVLDETGRVIARLDFAWPELGVWVEFDGRIKYEGLLKPGERASDVVVREKQREDRVRQLTGWRCIRLTWADLERPVATANTIRMAFRTPAA